MRTLRHIALVAAVLVGVSVSEIETADACTPETHCNGGHVYPMARTGVPANLPALYVSPRIGAGENQKPDSFDTSDVRFLEVKESGTERIPLTLYRRPDSEPQGGYLFKPDAPLRDDAQYRIETGDYCRGDGSLDGEEALSTSFRATEKAELPDSLGSLKILERETDDVQIENWYGGSCWHSLLASKVRLEVEFSDSALPWRYLFFFSTYVDGSSWSPSRSLANTNPRPGRSWIGRGEDLVYTVCESQLERDVGEDTYYDPLAEGTHQVEIRASIPGVDRTWTAGPVEIELRCPDQGDGPPDTAVDMNDSDVATTSRSDVTDAGAGRRERTRSNCSGCASSVGPQGSATGLPAFLVLVIAGGLRRSTGNTGG